MSTIIHKAINKKKISAKCFNKWKLNETIRSKVYIKVTFAKPNYHSSVLRCSFSMDLSRSFHPASERNSCFVGSFLWDYVPKTLSLRCTEREELFIRRNAEITSKEDFLWSWVIWENHFLEYCCLFSPSSLLLYDWRVYE